jgi:Transposase IS116/IS110/IS902 family
MEWHRASAASQRLTTIPGIGPITATAIVATVADAARFNSARQFAAWIGLVPRQHSSGGRERMRGLSKRGDGYLRRLLVHGARAVIRWQRRGQCASLAVARRAARTQTCKRRRCGARQQKCPHRPGAIDQGRGLCGKQKTPPIRSARIRKSIEVVVADGAVGAPAGEFAVRDDDFGDAGVDPT